MFKSCNILTLNLFSFLIISTISSIHLSSQDITTDLAEEFLEGLPASVRDEIEIQNDLADESELRSLFRSDTSLEKNKYILRKLQNQLDALDERFKNENSSKSKDELEIFGSKFFKSLQSSFMPINVPNLGPDYTVDVGDEFKLLLTGKMAEILELTVQRDGSILIQEFGKINIAGKSLDSAEKIISNFIKESSVGVSAYLTLSAVRDVQVLMLGGVESPGIYTVSGGSSILSVLNVAGGISSNGSYRKIELRRNGETIETIDLYDIFVFGNYSLNNTLRSGDTVFVHPKSFEIPVSGGVNNPAIFEALPEETITDLINYSGGFSEAFSGFDYVTVNQENLTSQNTLDLKVDQLASYKLSPRDAIMVPHFKSDIDSLKKVIIEGMVHRPGTYFFYEGETLSDIIQRAGGYTSNAYVYGAALFRKDALDKEKIFAQLNYADTVNYIVSSIGKPNININSSALDLLSEELRSRSLDGRVITDFYLENIKSDPSKDITIEDQDRIYVPALQKIVYLFGDFKNPSNLQFDSSFSVQDYIQLVGGLKDSAFNELVIIDPDGKTHVYSKRLLSRLNSVDIYPGSIIYAPRNIGKLSGVMYASTISPILSSLAISLASLNSISD
ncbi:SLBB domain-containing protein [Gammaproteobacteria bacterium]|nr:SLBB domain-containing protein [Gammaproteobacteria bacterium]